MARRPRFKPPKSVQCPACLDNGFLNIVGQPIAERGMRRTVGCELCGGYGRINQTERIDGWPKPELWTSYERKKKPPVVPLENGPGVKVWR